MNKREFSKLYKTKLRRSLVRLEKERQDILKKVIIITALVTAILGGTLYKLNFFNRDIFMNIRDTEGVFFLFLVVYGSIIGGVVHQFSKKYRLRYKSHIVRNILKLFFNDLHYLPDNRVARSLAEDSCFWQSHEMDRFNGDDYVSGKFGGQPIEFSEIHIQKEKRDSKGRRRHVTIFRGLLFALTLKKDYGQKTLILEDKTEKILGKSMGRFFQKKTSSKGYQLVELESSEFERHHCVYSTDQVQARVLLTPKVMSQMNKFRRKYKHSINISIQNNRLYLANSCGKTFEPRIFGTIVNFKDSAEIYSTLSILSSLTESLDIN